MKKQSPIYDRTVVELAPLRYKQHQNSLKLLCEAGKMHFNAFTIRSSAHIDHAVSGKRTFLLVVEMSVIPVLGAPVAHTFK